MLVEMVEEWQSEKIEPIFYKIKWLKNWRYVAKKTVHSPWMEMDVGIYTFL